MHSLRECGHFFCYSCLRRWFQQCLSEQVSYRNVPEDLRSPPYTAADFARFFKEKHIFVLLYRCPLCGVSVSKQPIQMHCLRELVEASFIAFRPPDELTETHPHLNDPNALWVDTFQKRSQ